MSYDVALNRIPYWEGTYYLPIEVVFGRDT